MCDAEYYNEYAEYVRSYVMKYVKYENKKCTILWKYAEHATQMHNKADSMHNMKEIVKTDKKQNFWENKGFLKIFWGGVPVLTDSLDLYMRFAAAV